MRFGATYHAKSISSNIDLTHCQYHSIVCKTAVLACKFSVFITNRFTTVQKEIEEQL